MKASTRSTGVALVFAVAVLSGCGQEAPLAEPTSSSPAATPTPTAATSAPAPTEDPAPVPFPADTELDSAEASPGAQLTVTDVRTGRHDGDDRVVFELAGTGTPGWFVAYVDQALDDPTDDVLDVAGDATLQVVLTGVQIPDHAVVPGYAGANPILTPDYPALREVNLRGVFEGQQPAFLGVDVPGRPFRVFALADPTRVIVDVRTDG